MGLHPNHLRVALCALFVFAALCRVTPAVDLSGTIATDTVFPPGSYTVTGHLTINAHVTFQSPSTISSAIGWTIVVNGILDSSGNQFTGFSTFSTFVDFRTGSSGTLSGNTFSNCRMHVRNSAPSLSFANNTFGGDLLHEGGDATYTGGSVAGNVTVSGGAPAFSGVAIGGTVMVTDDAAPTFEALGVGGNVTCRNTSSPTFDDVTVPGQFRLEHTCDPTITNCTINNPSGSAFRVDLGVFLHAPLAITGNDTSGSAGQWVDLQGTLSAGAVALTPVEGSDDFRLSLHATVSPGASLTIPGTASLSSPGGWTLTVQGALEAAGVPFIGFSANTPILIFQQISTGTIDQCTFTAAALRVDNSAGALAFANNTIGGHLDHRGGNATYSGGSVAGNVTVSGGAPTFTGVAMAGTVTVSGSAAPAFAALGVGGNVTCRDTSSPTFDGVTVPGQFRLENTCDPTIANCTINNPSGGPFRVDVGAFANAPLDIAGNDTAGSANQNVELQGTLSSGSVALAPVEGSEVFRLVNHVSVTAGAVLTIPGTATVLSPGGWWFNIQGTLVAVGVPFSSINANSPVLVFQQTSSGTVDQCTFSPGGIRVDNSAGTLAFTENSIGGNVQHAGGGASYTGGSIDGTVTVSGGAPVFTDVAIGGNVTVSGSATPVFEVPSIAGIVSCRDTSSPTFDGVAVTGQFQLEGACDPMIANCDIDYPAGGAFRIDVGVFLNAPLAISGNDTSGTAGPWIEVRGTLSAGSAALAAVQGSEDFRMVSHIEVLSGATLTIPGSATVSAPGGHSIHVEGTLHATGVPFTGLNANTPILYFRQVSTGGVEQCTFTTAGVRVDGSAPTLAFTDNTIGGNVEHRGGNATYSGGSIKGQIAVYDGAPRFEGIVIEGTATVRDTGAPTFDGNTIVGQIRFEGDAISPTVTANEFLTPAGGPLRLQPVSVPLASGIVGNTYDQADVKAVEIAGAFPDGVALLGDVDGLAAWSLIGNFMLSTNRGIELAPRITLYTGDSTLVVGAGGILSASRARILGSSRLANALQFQAAGTATLTLCEIRGRVLASGAGNPTVLGCEIDGDCELAAAGVSGFHGNVVRGRMDIRNGIAPLMTGNIFTAPGSGVDSWENAQPELHGNDIFGNAPWGVRNQTSAIVVNATGNWWGDASGPSGEGLGTGDAVSDFVLFDPIAFVHQADTDGDTLTNTQEQLLGTSPTYADTDGDNFSDKAEIVAGTDPLDGTDAPPDADADGLADSLEQDAPQDGRTHVLLPDSDGDGLDDGTEDANQSGYHEPGETFARMADSDGDGLEDGVEALVVSTDPLDAASPAAYSDADADRLPDSVDPDAGLADTDGDRFTDSYEAASLGLAAADNGAVLPDLGDTNDDMFVSNLDALIVQSVFLELFPPQLFAIGRSDANRDGQISNLDALIIQSFFLGLLPRFPAGL